MTDEHEKYLFETYASLFNLKETAMYPIAMFGIECGDGWFKLLDMLMRSIQSHIECNKDCPPVRVHQIKEKFGGLRFYYDGGDDIVHGMTTFAENLSYCICETCGSSENVKQTKGWISTICDKCATVSLNNDKKQAAD